MGRVKRYKKIKSCDPFAKVKRSEDTFHDEPPEEFEERRHKSKKRNSLNWDDDEDKEQLLQREAIRTIKLEQQKPQKKSKEIEPKRENETPKEFKARLRQDTRMTLYEELHKMTSTSKRRKEKMIERKKKKQTAKNVTTTGVHDDSILEFKSCEAVPFGATNLRPPELKSFGEKLTARMKAKSNQHTPKATEHSPQDEEDLIAEEDSDNENKKKRKGKKVKLADRDDLFGDDGLELSSAAERTPWNATTIPSSNKSINKSSSSSSSSGAGKKTTANLPSNNKKSKVSTSNSNSSSDNNNVTQMELMRKRVIEAYAKIREKRRSTSAAYQT